MMPILKTVELEFTVLEFRENFVVSYPKEDVVIGPRELEKLLETCLGFYGEQSYVYISRRMNKYNVNPVIYFGLEKTKNLLGIAVVCSEGNAAQTAQFEKSFAKVPYEVFQDCNEALEWKDELLKK